MLSKTSLVGQVHSSAEKKPEQRQAQGRGNKEAITEEDEYLRQAIKRKNLGIRNHKKFEE